MNKLIELIIVAGIVFSPATSYADDESKGGGLAKFFGLGDDDEDAQNTPGGTANSDDQDGTQASPFAIKSSVPESLTLKDPHAALEGGWIVEFDGGEYNDTQMAEVVIQKGIEHKCWSGEGGGCWAEYRRAADGPWLMQIVGLKFPSEDVSVWKAPMDDASLGIEGNELGIVHGWYTFRQTPAKGSEKVSLDSLGAGRLSGKWAQSNTAGTSKWTRVSPKINSVLVTSRDTTGEEHANVSEFSEASGGVEEVLVANIPYDPYWWDPTKFHLHDNAPSFSIEVYGDNLWASRYAWIAYETGLEVTSSYVCADGSAWAWWGGFEYCRTQNSKVIGMRHTMRVWSSAVPGMKELIVDGISIPFELKIDGFPDIEPLAVELGYRSPDNEPLDEIVTGEPFYVVATTFFENTAANSILPVSVTIVGPQSVTSRNVTLRPTSEEGRYASDAALILEKRVTELVSSDVGGAQFSPGIPADLAGRYTLTLERFSGDDDLRSNIDLDKGRTRLTFDAKLGDKDVIVDAEIARARSYEPNSGPFRAALELKLLEVSDSGANAYTPLSQTMLARRNANVIAVDADAENIVLGFGEDVNSVPVVAASPVVDNAQPPEITTVNLFSRADPDLLAGDWGTQTGESEYVPGLKAWLKAICRESDAQQCFAMELPVVESPPGNEQAVIRVFQDGSVQTGGGYILYREEFDVEVELPSSGSSEKDPANPEKISVSFYEAGESDDEGRSLTLRRVPGKDNLYRSSSKISPKSGGGTKWYELSRSIGGFDTKGHGEPLRIRYKDTFADYVFVSSNAHKIAQNRIDRYKAIISAIEGVLQRDGLSVEEFRELGNPDTSADRRELLSHITLHPDTEKNYRGRIIYLQAMIAKIEGPLSEAQQIEADSWYQDAGDPERVSAAAWAMTLIYNEQHGDYGSVVDDGWVVDDPGPLAARLGIPYSFEFSMNRKSMSSEAFVRLSKQASIASFRHAMSLVPPWDKFIKVTGYDPTKPIQEDGTYVVLSRDEYIENLAELGLQAVQDKVFKKAGEHVAETVAGYGTASRPSVAGGSNRPSGANQVDEFAPTVIDRPAGPSRTKTVIDGALGSDDLTPTIVGGPDAHSGADAFGVPSRFTDRQTELYQRLSNLGVSHENALLQAQVHAGRQGIDSNTALAGVAVLGSIDPNLLVRELGMSRADVSDHIERFLMDAGMAKSAGQARQMTDSYMNRSAVDRSSNETQRLNLGDTTLPPPGFDDLTTIGHAPTVPPAHVAPPAAAPVSLPPLEVKTYTTPEGPRAVVVSDPIRPTTKVRFEIQEQGVVDVTDINSAALGRGMGPQLLAQSLRQSDVDLRHNFQFSAINNPPTLEAFVNGIPAAESVLGRTGLRTAELLGIPIRNVRYQLYYHNSKLRIIFEVGE